MTTIFKEFAFEAAHRLPHVPAGHKCGRLHGHSYRVEVHVSGTVDARTGMVMDFGDIKEAWKPLDEALDHRYLNELWNLENPTSENLARFVLERVQLAQGKLAAVSVAETCTSRCIVHADP